MGTPSSTATSFSWGRGRHGVLGDGTAEEGEAPPSSPRIVAGPLNGRRISQLCCGELHTLALTAEAGAVFSWGSGLMGALGHGGRSNELAPRRVEAVPFATQLAAGKHHSAALCPDGGGAVLAWGWDGWEGSACAKTPARLSHLAAGSGRLIAAGAFHLSVLTKQDGVVSSGGGVVQAGVLRDVAIVQLAAGTRHTAVLTSDAQVYTWQHAAVRGTVGGSAATASAAGPPMHVPPQPTRCVWLGGALKLACGGDYTLALLLTADGSRLVRWQHVGARDGAAPAPASHDTRDAGEVAAPLAEQLVVGGGYALVLRSDGSAQCLSTGPGGGGGGGGGAGGFGGLPLGLAPVLATPGERLALPVGRGQRLACLALGDFHAVACVHLDSGTHPTFSAAGPAELSAVLSADPRLVPRTDRQLVPPPPPPSAAVSGRGSLQPPPELAPCTPEVRASSGGGAYYNGGSAAYSGGYSGGACWSDGGMPSGGGGFAGGYPYAAAPVHPAPQSAFAPPPQPPPSAYNYPPMPPPMPPPATLSDAIARSEPPGLYTRTSLIQSPGRSSEPPGLYLGQPPPATAYAAMPPALPPPSAAASPQPIPAGMAIVHSSSGEAQSVAEVYAASFQATSSRFAARDVAASSSTPESRVGTGGAGRGSRALVSTSVSGTPAKSPTELEWQQQWARLQSLTPAAKVAHDDDEGAVAGGSGGRGASALTPSRSPGGRTSASAKVAALEAELRQLRASMGLGPSVHASAGATRATTTARAAAPPAAATASALVAAPAAAPPWTASAATSAATSVALSGAGGAVPDALVKELVAHVGAALRADLLAEVKRDLAAEMRSQVQGMQQALLAILQPHASSSSREAGKHNEPSQNLPRTFPEHNEPSQSKSEARNLPRTFPESEARKPAAPIGAAPAPTAALLSPRHAHPTSSSSARVAASPHRGCGSLRDVHAPSHRTSMVTSSGTSPAYALRLADSADANAAPPAAAAAPRTPHSSSRLLGRGLDAEGSPYSPHPTSLHGPSPLSASYSVPMPETPSRQIVSSRQIVTSRQIVSCSAPPRPF